MRPNRDEPWLCHKCGYMMDANSPAAVGKRITPREGDLSLCMNCGALYVRHGVRWAPITPAEWNSLDGKMRRQLATMEAARASAMDADLTRRDRRA